MSSQQHIQQWRHNRSFLTTIDPQYPDWAVTVAFYIALQAVDSLLSHDKVTGIVSHETRNDALMRTRRYQQIWRHYRPLHDVSRTVRYLANPANWLAWNEVDSVILKRGLYPIEQSVQKLIGQDLALPAIALR